MNNLSSSPRRKRSIPPANYRLLLLLVVSAALIVWLSQVSLPGQRLEGCPDGCAQESGQDDGLIRILSLNMLHGFPGFEDLDVRVSSIINRIKQLDADIVLLQEVPRGLRSGNVPVQLAEGLSMNYLYYRANGNRSAILFEEGELILSRLPLRNGGFYELRPAAGAFEHRTVLHAEVDSPGGSLKVFVTHLTSGDPVINRQQTESLLDYVKTSSNLPKIIAGDFNASESSPQIMTLAQEWVDAYRLFNPDDQGFTCCLDDLKSEPAEPFEKRIDYIFLAGSEQAELTLLDAQRVFDQPERTSNGWQWASDHAGVMVTIQSGR